MAKRGKGNQVAIYVIVGLICVAMLGFGATNFGGTISSIGRVGDRQISVNRYANRLQSMLRQISAQTGQNITFAQAQLFGIDAQALQETVSAVALEHEAASLGISVGDAQVREEVLQVTAFQGLDGQFDREAYAETLRRSNMNEREFEADLRAELSRTLVQQSVVSGVSLPDIYADTLVNFIGERRTFTWMALSPDALEAPVAAPTEAEARSFYDANESAFMLPETRKITYAWLTPEMLAADIVLDEEELRELYQERIDEYVTPERRLVERLVLGAEAEAAKAQLDSGEITFEELVASRDLELSDIDLGDVSEVDLGDAGAAVFALTEPGIAGPVDGEFGATLYRVNAILNAQERSFEEVRAELETELGLEKAQDEIGAMLEDIDDLLAGGATVEEVADETRLELGDIDWSVESEGGIADFAAFRQAAAAAEAGDFPEIIESDDGGVFAIRLNEVVEPRLDTFENARQQAEEGWTAQATVEALEAHAETIAETLRTANDAELGESLEIQSNLTRESFVPGSSPDFLNQVFELDEGEVRVVSDEGVVQIVRLDDVLPPDSSDERLAARREALIGASEQGIGTDMLAAFVQAVELEAGIFLDQAAINAVHAHLP